MHVPRHSLARFYKTAVKARPLSSAIGWIFLLAALAKLIS